MTYKEEFITFMVRSGVLTFGVGTVVAIAFIALIIFLLVRKPAKADSTEGLRRMSVDAN